MYIHTGTYVYCQYTITVLEKSLHVDAPEPRHHDGLGTRLGEDGLSQRPLCIVLDEHLRGGDARTHNHLRVDDSDGKIRLAPDSIAPLVCGAVGFNVRCADFLAHLLGKILQRLAHTVTAVERDGELGDKWNDDAV